MALQPTNWVDNTGQQADAAYLNALGGAVNAANLNGAFTAPPTTGWTAVNAGSAGLTSSLDGMLLTAPSNGSVNSVHMWMRTLSPASSYTVTAYLEISGAPANAWGPVGLTLRNAAGGGLIVFGPAWGSGTATVRITKFSSPTTFTADYLTAVPVYAFHAPINWYRIRDNGTNRFFEYSYNGVDWETLHPVGRTDFITPDQIGVAGDPHSTAITARLRSWSVV